MNVTLYICLQVSSGITTKIILATTNKQKTKKIHSSKTSGQESTQSIPIGSTPKSLNSKPDDKEQGNHQSSVSAIIGGSIGALAFISLISLMVCIQK